MKLRESKPLRVDFYARLNELKVAKTLKTSKLKKLALFAMDDK